MNFIPIPPHPIEQILLIPKEKLVLNKDDWVNMKSPCSFLVIDVAQCPFIKLCLQVDFNHTNIHAIINYFVNIVY